MNIEKSTRHQKIIGDFGERILLNWLSRSGFETCLVDHTGLDVIAYQARSGRRLGFTVKSRTRDAGKEKDSVNIFSYQRGKNDRQKLLDACKAFACEPWLAVYVERLDSADLYLTSLAHYDQEYRLREGRSLDYWRMGEKNIKQYTQDAAVRHIRMIFHAENWNWS